MRVLAADPYAAVTPGGGVDMVPLERLLVTSDHIVCLATATAETSNMMNAAAFARMRPDSVFINLSRGELVDDAALDVGRAPDQMPAPELARLPNVIATPNVGGRTPQPIEAQAFDTVNQMRALVAGAVPQGAVNAEQWTRRLAVAGARSAR
jgi:D-3-phosphoglycerate dehydrogenase